MKSLLLVTVALVVLTNAAPDEEAKQKMMEHITACVAEAGTPSTFMDKVATKDFASLTHDEQCILKCALVKSGMMTEAGEFDIANIEAKMDAHNVPAEARAMAMECLQLKGADPCETAAISAECSISKMQ